LRETVSVVMRMLDNVIDINFYPLEAAPDSNRKHRPVGLGVMGMQDALYAKRVPFDTPEASPSMTRCSKSWPSPPTTPRAIWPVNAASTLPLPVPNETGACSRWTGLTCSNENAACPSRPTALHFSLGMNYAAASAAWVDRYLINSPMLSGMKENPDESITLYIQKVSPRRSGRP
jgi:hypothetical protein